MGREEDGVGEKVDYKCVNLLKRPNVIPYIDRRCTYKGVATKFNQDPQ